MTDSTHYKLRKIPRWRRLLLPALAPLITLAIRLYWSTVRVKEVIGREHLDALAAEGKPMIPCHWHQRQVFCTSYLFRTRRHDFKMSGLVSPSRDGELAALVLRQLGAHPIRGSGRRTGAQAMRELYMAMKNEGLSPVMAPDGSKGPIYQFKPGSVMLSQLSGAPMVPVTFAARHAWKLSTWDHFVVPYPFSSITFAIGAPQYVPKGSKFGDTAAMQEVMRRALNEVDEVAERAVSGG
ncbi:MAG: lysophospholipid acyltransferase (LPLAT)-like uncharacterized protein [Chlamydiales bacterium]